LADNEDGVSKRTKILNGHTPSLNHTLPPDDDEVKIPDSPEAQTTPLFSRSARNFEEVTISNLPSPIPEVAVETEAEAEGGEKEKQTNPNYFVVFMTPST
jgi:hypothetical protein